MNKLEIYEKLQKLVLNKIYQYYQRFYLTKVQKYITYY